MIFKYIYTECFNSKKCFLNYTHTKTTVLDWTELQLIGDIYCSLTNILSSKYLLICFVFCLYLSYTSINDKTVLNSYTIDSYNDFLLNKITSKIISISKFNIHYLNNKVLHPITLFLQNT